MSPWSKGRLGAEIVVTYASVRLAMRRNEIKTLVKTLRRERRSGLRPVTADRRQLSGAVMGVLALLPTDSRCLVRSLVYLRLLARRGIDGKLVIGVRTEPRFLAHAWVECDGMPMLPSTDDTGWFEPLTVL